jgi:dihydrofolate synthase / folylpolyglutamate synthase
MTYNQAIQFLYDLRLFGAKLGLTNTLQLAELAGNPHHQLRFIHVAGTNGKGSTCAMLESIYRAAGLRVGLYTSPHLVLFGERIQVNRELISEEAVVRAVSEMQELLKRFPPGEHPTFFEVVTVMALLHFAAAKCDLVIWETGLGGRLDATNIVAPLASVITNIQYDHQQWLGKTLSSIAFEKAGIVKQSIPVVTATAEPEALQVIEDICRQKNAALTRVTEADTRVPPLNAMELPLRGQHQRLNAALALATVRELAPELPVHEDTIVSGLKNVRWPGRLQLIQQDFGRKLLLDGAHNVAGAETLATVLKEDFRSEKPVLILGTLGDKDVEAIAHILAPLVSRIVLVPVSSQRTAAPAELQAACQQANPSSQTTLCNSVAEALDLTIHEPFVLVTGSLYLVGEAIEALKNPPRSTLPERCLNEWNPKV